MPAKELETISKQTRQWDFKTPQTFVIGIATPAKTYGHIADILMLDWYPVPHLELDSVADQIDTAHKYLPRGKPLWMVLQAMDWRDYPQTGSGPKIGRFPNLLEIRFMSYLAIVHGAKGLFYFTLGQPGGTLFDYPEKWQALARVVGEIKALQPSLQKGRATPLPFSNHDLALEGAAWRYHGRDYVIILNRSKNRSIPAPKELLTRRWRPLFEVYRDLRDMLKKEGTEWVLAPHQALVLESGFRL